MKYDTLYHAISKCHRQLSLFCMYYTDLKINMEYFIFSLHYFVEQHILISWGVCMIC